MDEEPLKSSVLIYRRVIPYYAQNFPRGEIQFILFQRKFFV